MLMIDHQFKSGLIWATKRPLTGLPLVSLDLTPNEELKQNFKIY